MNSIMILLIKTIRCKRFTIKLYKDMAEKVKKVKILHDLVRKLNKVGENTLHNTYGVC